MRQAADAASPGLALDHLVVAARTIDDGVAWCEATLGVVPAPGGRHALMGTHNRLLALSSARFPRCYLEVVAIDPDAAAPGRSRWFDLDTAAIQDAIAAMPQLVHWVARTTSIDAAVAAFRQAGHDPGAPTMAERMTARGLLRWHITVRDDGVRPGDGAVPALIEWGDEHPCDALAASGVALEHVEVASEPPAFVAGLSVVEPDHLEEAPPALVAILDTPRGRVALASPPRRSAG